jgi:hypothetical protein
MDELDQLRVLGDDVPEANPDEFESARVDFMERLSLETTPRGRRPRSRVRWLVAASAAAVAVVLAVVAPALLPGGSLGGAAVAAAGIGFTEKNDYVVATIDDPTVSAAEMQAAFAEHGFDIQVRLEPVSPSMVGTIPIMDLEDSGTPPDQRIQQIIGPCPGEPDGCTTGLRIPMGYASQAAIVVGRAAALGEPYATANDAFAPGEVLHCSGIRRMTVADAWPILHRLGVTPIWHIFGQAQNTEPAGGIDQASIANDFVDVADPYSPDAVSITVAPTVLGPSDLNLSRSQWDDYERSIERLDRGCG